MVLKRYEKIILVAVLILTFFINGFYGHYKYPIHGDEYAHLAQAKDIIYKGKIEMTNPYLKSGIGHIRLENGFHVLLAIFISIFNDHFIFLFNILKNFVFVLNTSLIFYFIYDNSKKFSLAIFSTIYFIFLKSSLDLLGNLFLLPLNIGLTLILLFFIFYNKYEETKKKKFFFWMIIIFILSGVIYPLGLIFIFIIIILIFVFRLAKLNKDYIILLILMIFLGLLVSAKLLWTGDIISTLKNILYNHIIFQKNWTPVQANYSPISYYGALSFLLSFVGLFSLFMNKVKENKALIVWFLFSLLNIFFFYFLNVNIFLPFQRIFYLYLVSLAILSGYGLYFILGILSHSIKKYKILILSVIVIIVFFIHFLYFFYNAKSFEAVPILDDSTYQALRFIEETYGTKINLMADSFIGLGVYPISENYVVSLLDSNLGSVNRDIQTNFFNGDCDVKKELIIKNKIQGVVTKTNISCPFLKLVYNKGINGYEVVN
ncbi:hypothetical protein COU57_06160 [Candidatus Pacearchaeota archaeon CG10_big_fil_rev_8_21_14_0_10_32_14]|nr:MAG: hypothetical protein COU57_06160 [Candidatus Pacearchaeota archaeon CG10_big_fil_rev_8_21_14_0_10_32_14]